MSPTPKPRTRTASYVTDEMAAAFVELGEGCTRDQLHGRGFSDDEIAAYRVNAARAAQRRMTSEHRAGSNSHA